MENYRTKTRKTYRLPGILIYKGENYWYSAKLCAHQRVAGFVHVIEAHIAHPRVHHPPTPILKRSNQLVRLGVLLLSRERLDRDEVLKTSRAIVKYTRVRLLSSNLRRTKSFQTSSPNNSDGNPRVEHSLHRCSR